MRGAIWFWLILVQTIWAGTYVGMKIAATAMPIGAVVFLRYGMASLGLFIASLRVGFPKFTKRDLLLMAVLGVANFALAPVMQIWSLTKTQAVDVSIIVATEPVLTVLGAALLLGEKLAPSTLLAAGGATLGMAVLSGAGVGDASMSTERLLGNAVFLGSLLFEASVSISGKPLTARYSPIPIMFGMKFAGFVASSLFWSPVLLATDFTAIPLDGWLAVLYLGAFASVFGYTLWYWLIQRTPVNQIALSLYVQPIAGALLGYLVLSEKFTEATWIGAVIILASLLSWQWLARRERLKPDPLKHD